MVLLLFFILIVFSILVYMWRIAKSDRIIEHHLQFPSFPESFGKLTIFFISDIHKRVVGEKIIQAAKEKADIVVIGGDLAEKGVPFSRIKENLGRLKEIGPMYFVWGNNDYEIDYHLLDATLLDFGVKILDNTSVTFESYQGDKVCLLGIDYLGANRDNIDLAVMDSAPNSFRILVSHDPSIVRKINPEHSIDLVLSGHTHGGQIRLLGMGPYELGKVTVENGLTLLVSNGYGTTLVPFRLEAKPETHLIEITHSSS
ncbi:metallophosphoesterase [Peribacillus tepidiphilus]|jgi:predicted MPP superfamily phosphohydrolase|uniref:metallophosphoesterase n=1 Tax=Peribacillus tepidiphilus TaxID=2652445 RepID=UPI0035B550EE